MKRIKIRADLRGLAEGFLAKRLLGSGYGEEAGEGLVLRPLEVLHVLERGIAVADMDGRTLGFEAVASLAEEQYPRILDSYLVFRDLRRIGVRARAAEDGILVGGSRVLVRRPEDPFPLDDLLGLEPGKEAYLAIPDREGDITYYSVRGLEYLEGSIPLPRGRFRCEALGTRFLVPGEYGELAELMYGVETGMGLLLSQEEYSFLHRLGAAEGPDPGRGPFDEIYSTLRLWGVAPKSGLKFGALYRIYASRESRHSEWLLSPASDVSSMSVLAGLARVSHAVRKTLLLWTGKRPKLLSIRWVKRPSPP